MDVIKEIVEVIYLEDLKEKIGFVIKLKVLVKVSVLSLGLCFLGGVIVEFCDKVVIFFMLGLEGLFKGVVFSYKNL